MSDGRTRVELTEEVGECRVEYAAEAETVMEATNALLKVVREHEPWP